jgi:competence protein ComEC
MLLGEKDELSKEEKELFNRANLSHILVVSGYNISLVISFVFLLLKSFHRYIRTGGALILIFLFVLLVGFDASVVRSALMGSIVVFSKILYRKTSSTHTLFLVAICMLCIQPILLFDAGFHLSFLATYSLCILPQIKKIPEYILTTVWVFIFLSIYIVYISQSFSFVGIFTNIGILMCIPFFMFISFVSICISLFHIYIGIDVFLLEIISRYIFFIAHISQFVPRFEDQIPPQFVVGVYVLILSSITFIQNIYTTKEFMEKHYQKFVPQKTN